MIEFELDISPESVIVNLTLNTFHQKLPFNAVHCGKFFAGKNYFTKRDSLDNYLLIVTTDGTGEMTWRAKSCILNPGSAVLIDCNTLHEYRTAHNGRWSFYFIHFNTMSIGGYSSVLLKNLTPVMLNAPGRVYDFMEDVCRISPDAQGKDYFVISNIISGILTEMICSVSGSNLPFVTPGREDITELQEYIKTNCTDELGIDSFMKKINLSRHYLIHIFKEQTGMAPCQYMHMCRVSRSQKLLTESDMSVSQIAEAVGYSGAAVFIRHFRNFNNITPDKYRREFRCYHEKL